MFEKSLIIYILFPTFVDKDTQIKLTQTAYMVET
jgi:hypothetical protein